MKTRITELFGIRYPVILASMANRAHAELAAAVSEAGGLGMIGCGRQGGHSWLQEQCDATRRATDKPFGIGFIQWVIEEDPAAWEYALTLHPHAVALSFGAPEVYIEKAKMAGITVIYQAQTVALAKRAAAAGADAVVAQGTEAGGHTGFVPTLPLVPAVVDAIHPVPVIAAGGIADGRGIAAALMLGAEGVWMGTRFLASLEAEAHANYKQRIVDAQTGQTVLTTVYDIVGNLDFPAGIAGRVLQNRFTERWHGHEQELRQALDFERPLVAAAATAGDMDTAVAWAGEASGLITSVLPAGQIVRDLFEDAEAILRHRPGAILDDGV